MKEIEKYYRFLHQNPELSGEEVNTSKFVVDILKQYDIELTLVDYSVICYFDKGKSESVAFRSELDALPIKEGESNLIKSDNGCMHACGHDVHTSALLKLAEIISDNTYEKNVCLIFQSKEETGAGSKQIINSNIFSKYNIKEIIGLHVWPNLDFDKLYSNEELMFGSYELDIVIKGESNHISSYDRRLDATYAAYLIYDEINKISGDLICHLGKITSGVARNISSDLAIMNYSIRYMNKDNVKDIITAISINSDCEVNYNFISNYPCLVNDLELMNKVEYRNIDTLKSAEDFGNYSSVTKTLYLLYGLGKGNNLHSSSFYTTKEQREKYYMKLKSILDIYKSR